MRLSFSLLTLGLVTAVAVPTAQANHAHGYYGGYGQLTPPVPQFRSDEHVVKTYGYPSNQLRWTELDYQVLTSPYRARRAALHPVYRHNQYNVDVYANRNRREVTHPLFHKYLRDLYYSGQLGGGYRGNRTGFDFGARRFYGTNPAHNCYNYRTKRTSQFVPSRFKGCF